MAISVISADTIGAGERATLASNATTHVLEGVRVISTSTNAITAGGTTTGAALVVAGTVIGEGNGVFLAGGDDGGNSVTVSDTGSVMGTGFTGIALEAPGAALVNHGHIQSQRSVAAYAPNTDAYMENHGAIVSVASGTFAAGVQFLGVGGVLRNFGEITASGANGRGVSVLTPVDAPTLIENFGTIAGRRLGVEGGAGSETLRNGGTILGDVRLGAGDDVFDGRGGTVRGRVEGGDGNDVLRAGDLGGELRGDLGDDLLFGGPGDDLLNGGSGDDTVRGGPGDDELRGAAGADTVYGGTGDDTIFGGEGADILSGGAGVNFLAGGPGRDVFLFRRVLFEDRITDFEDGRDRLDLSVYGFGAAAEVRALAEDTSRGLLIDLAERGGGTVLLDGVVRADLGSADLLL